MSKKANKKEDTISQLKKEENKIKKDLKKEEEDENSDDEEEENQNVVKEQTVQKSDKPKNLKDLLNSMGDNKPKPKKKEKEGKKNKNKNEEPVKLTFINSKNSGNAYKIDEEARKNTEKKVYKNAGGLDKAAKENEKIKHTKDYLEKDEKKQYKDVDEDVAKPQFTTNVKGEENFVELNQSEDVRKLIILIKILML